MLNKTTDFFRVEDIIVGELIYPSKLTSRKFPNRIGCYLARSEKEPSATFQKIKYDH